MAAAGQRRSPLPLQRRPRASAGSFAKRTGASTRLSRRIGWLNNHGGLLAEIQYSEVKDVLTEVGEAAALQLLRRLEQAAGEVRDPTSYLLSSARRELGDEDEAEAAGAAAAAAAEEEGEEGGEEDAPRPSSAAAEDEDGEPAAEAAAAEGGGGAEPRKAPSHRTTRRKRPRPPRLRGEADALGRVGRRVAWLNANAGLMKELRMEEVGQELVRVGIPAAMEILKRLERFPKEMQDPNSYVLGATGRRASEAPSSRAAAPRPKAAAGAGGQEALRHVLKRNLKAKPKQLSRLDMAERVRKRVAWLNRNAGLAAKLDFAAVGPLLVEAGDPKEVMELLKTLETKAAEVRDPNAYITRSAKRLALDGRVGPIKREERAERDSRLGKSGRTAAGIPAGTPAAGPRDVENQRVMRRVSWLNERGRLAAPLLFDRIAPLLMDLDPRQALEILKQLEERAGEVRDPTAYVAVAAHRALAGGGPSAGPHDFRPLPPKPMPAAAPALPPPPPPLEGPEEKLRRRVAWLNEHVPLPAPLDFGRVAPGLLGVSREAALDVLNDLEEHYSTVRDPTAFVIANTRRLMGVVVGRGLDRPPRSSGSSNFPLMESPQVPPMGPSEEKLERRLAWLNRNVCPHAPLDFDRLLPPLLRLSMRDAMELLKNFEANARDVRDPTGYIAIGIRRAMQGAPVSQADMRDSEGGCMPRNGRDSKGGGSARPSPRGALPPRPSSTLVYGAVPSSSSSRGRERSPRPIGKGGGRSPMPPPPAVGPSAVDGNATYYGAPIRRGGTHDGATSYRSAGDSAASTASEQDDAGRLRRRIDWLNGHVKLALPLSYNEVSSALLRLDWRQAMEVLKRLEATAREVRDPNGFVISAARRKGGGRGQQPRRRSPPPPRRGSGAAAAASDDGGDGAAEGSGADEEDDDAEDRPAEAAED